MKKLIIILLLAHSCIASAQQDTLTVISWNIGMLFPKKYNDDVTTKYYRGGFTDIALPGEVYVLTEVYPGNESVHNDRCYCYERHTHMLTSLNCVTWGSNFQTPVVVLDTSVINHRIQALDFGTFIIVPAHLHTYLGKRRFAVMKAIVEWAQTVNKPVIIAGDYNTRGTHWKGKLIVNNWDKKLFQLLRDAGFMDAGFEQNTYRFAPARIDWIFARGMNEYSAIKTKGVSPFDHIPIMTKLILKTE